MSSAWSISFKKRMMQLKLAVRDPETGEINVGCFGDIHDDIMQRMNDARDADGLPEYDLDLLYDEHRGYINRKTGEFMTAAEASEWACKFETERWWCGESGSLLSKQSAIVRGNPLTYGGK